MGIAAQVDAYYSGKSIPDLFLYLTAGAAHGATLPNYPAHGAPEKEKSKVLISALITIGGFGLIAFSIGAFLSDWVSRTFFIGLEGEYLTIASRTMALFFISGIFRIFVSILHSYYDHVYQFFLPAALDLLLTILPIAFMLLLGDKLGVLSLPLGFLGASILIAGFLFAGLAKGFDIHWSLSLDFRALRSIITLLPPLALGSLAYKINAVIDRIFASGFVVGTISSLQYGYNPLYVIHAVVSVPISSALFPLFSQKILTNDFEDLRRIAAKALRLLMPINLWGMWILLFFRTEIITILYGRGAFDARAIELTSLALLFYSFGFSMFSANTIFLRIMMSAQDKAGLYTLGILSIALNLMGDWILGNYYQLAGIATTTSIVHIVWAFVAYFFIRKKIGNFVHRLDLTFLLVILAVSFGAVYTSNLGVRWLSSNYFIDLHPFIYNVLILGLGSAFSVLILTTILFLLRVPEIDLVLLEVKRVRIHFLEKLLRGRESLP
jgi:putative peptidoglycan lipid II flippase